MASTSATWAAFNPSPARAGSLATAGAWDSRMGASAMIGRLPGGERSVGPNQALALKAFNCPLPVAEVLEAVFSQLPLGTRAQASAW